jgi:cobalamin biosynthesis protein CobC
MAARGRIAHGGALAAAMARHGGTRADWLDLSTGINPCPPNLPAIPHHAFATLPDADAMAACIAAARRFHGFGSQAALLAAPGVQALIQLLPRLRPHAPCRVLGPTYGEYVHVFQQFGVGVEETDSVAGLGAGGIAVIVNPDNPSGRIVAPERLAALAATMAEKGGLLVVDEAFCDMTPEHSIANLAGRPGLLVLKSFGKFFGLAGLRLGFAAGASDDVKLLEALLGPWAVGGPALAAGAALMADDALCARIRSRIAELAAAQCDVLDKAGLVVAADCGLFQLADVADAAALSGHLAQVRILTRIFDWQPRWIRFGLCPNDAARARLAAALAGLPRGQNG